MQELPRSYEPSTIEAELFKSWDEAGYFDRSAAGFANEALDPYTVVIPPPNVTGVLHMGHALNNTLQDILVRIARMKGQPTRWIVGTDHAGIATQNKVEQKLTEEGLTRFDLGRKAFVEACWDWRQSYGSVIIEQLKAMGCSCDYAHEQFTMDPDYARAIRKVFVDWYNAGLIYRGHRIINWCPRCTTALADDEVEHHEECGSLWYLRYPLSEPVDGVEYLVVATTRPETMLGDTGVAVNPNDEQYKALLDSGATILLPLMEREIPLFADEYVDPDFGTGAVKVTPAHDPNDFAMGERHDLEQINIFDEHAVLTSAAGRFAGLTREQAREAVVRNMEELGLLERVEEHQHAVGHCYRCDTTIEPWLSEQWFVAMKELAAPALEAVRSGAVRFYPRRWENTYFHWMEHIRDWCISRQLWWGHRIPVFYCSSCGWVGASEHDLILCPVCNGRLEQDEDVLDTWFSSQLWPFATQGWPAQPGWEEELAAYYPTQVLSTARDIIFLWVARMVLSSLYFVEDVPFNDVLIHPTVLDRFGNIMSKSRGNGVDPLELIASYGADGMRFGLALQVTGNQDMKFNEDKLLGSRNFATKIWNAARYVLMHIEGLRFAPGRIEPEPATEADRWILSRLAGLTRSLNDPETRYDFGAHARRLQRFFWNEFCDWYIEISKGQLTREALRQSTAQNLVFVLDQALRLLHPYMPFITEKIWQSIPHGDTRPSLMVAAWPDDKALAAYLHPDAERRLSLLLDVVATVRSVRARYGISPKQPLAVVVRTAGESAASHAESLSSLSLMLTQLGNLASFTAGEDADRPDNASVTVTDELEIFVELEGLVDFAVERERLSKEQEKLEADRARLESKLSNQGFLSKAAPEIVEKTRTDAAEMADALSRIAAQLESLPR
ncbi:MAG: valine--tRNA ligase [Coriobacteriales bacterium]|jgi:valyl-tRNA synthetase|nr:valine--tRNA ligase [Coriobacteriales bacterium]